MAKPLGIVAMLTLLISSGTALADHHVYTKAVDHIKVTNTNKVHFELKTGQTITGDLPNCDVMQFVEITGNNNLGLYTSGRRFVTEGSRITFVNLGERNMRKRAVGSCNVQNLGERNVDLLLAKN